jgi:hypothetical protein
MNHPCLLGSEWQSTGAGNPIQQSDAGVDVGKHVFSDREREPSRAPSQGPKIIHAELCRNDRLYPNCSNSVFRTAALAFVSFLFRCSPPSDLPPSDTASRPEAAGPGRSHWASTAVPMIHRQRAPRRRALQRERRRGALGRRPFAGGSLGRLSAAVCCSRSVGLAQPAEAPRCTVAPGDTGSAPGRGLRGPLCGHRSPILLHLRSLKTLANPPFCQLARAATAEPVPGSAVPCHFWLVPRPTPAVPDMLLACSRRKDRCTRYLGRPAPESHD